MKAKQSSEISTEQQIGSELQLISRAQRGDEKALFGLYELYKRRVYSLCLRISGAAEEAEELTREVFLRVFRGISAFTDEAEFAAALEELSIRLALSARREMKCHPPSGEEIKPQRESSVAKDLTRGARPNRERLLLRDLGIDAGPCFWN
jgi:RNA polymerase sigma-70 factor, ECF subfamily